MRSRARMRFADYFNPADFAHVNWLQRHKSTLLTGEQAEQLPLRDFDTAVEDDAGAHDEQAADTWDTAQEMGSAFAPIDEEESSPRPAAEWLDRYRVEEAYSDLAPFLSAREPLHSTRTNHTGVLEAQGSALQPSRSPIELLEQYTEVEPEGSIGSLRPALRHRLPGESRSVKNSEVWQTLPDEGRAEARTLEHRPEEGEPVVQPVVQRTADGRVRFQRDNDYRRFTVGCDQNGRCYMFPIDTGTIETDRPFSGNQRKIPAWRNRSTDRHRDTNCHGFVFANGELWINDEHVDNLLKGDCYVRIPEDRARAGDVVIYRGPRCERGRADRSQWNLPIHSAVLRRRDETGWYVEGKRGTESARTRVSRINEQWTGSDNCGVPPRQEIWRKTYPCR